MSALAPAEAVVVEELLDYEGEESRFAIYTAPRQPALPSQRRLAETSLDGIGLCLVTLREDGDITDDTRVGIYDRLDRVWIANPWARGDLP